MKEVGERIKARRVGSSLKKGRLQIGGGDGDGRRLDGRLVTAIGTYVLSVFQKENSTQKVDGSVHGDKVF